MNGVDFNLAALGLFDLGHRGLDGGWTSAMRGPRGETLLHWALFHGKARLACRWLEFGGSVETDSSGNTPLHWVAAAQSSALDSLCQDDRLVEILRPHASALDGLGRDPLGLLCAMRSPCSIALYARSFPEAARLGAALGLGERLSLADALVANGIRADQDDLERSMLDAGAAPASKGLPEPLSRGGQWSEELWALGLQALLGEGSWARMQAQEIKEACAEASLAPRPALRV